MPLKDLTAKRPGQICILKKKKKKISLTGLEVRVRGRKTNLGAFERFA